MQRLHAAVHHLGESGDVGDVADRQTGVGKRFGGPAGRDQLDAELIQAFSEIRKAVLSETLRIARIFGDLLDISRQNP